MAFANLSVSQSDELKLQSVSDDDYAFGILFTHLDKEQHKYGHERNALRPRVARDCTR